MWRTPVTRRSLESERGQRKEQRWFLLWRVKWQEWIVYLVCPLLLLLLWCYCCLSLYVCVLWHLPLCHLQSEHDNLYLSRESEILTQFWYPVLFYRNYQGISKVVWIQHMNIWVKLKSGLDRSDGLTRWLADTTILKVTPLTYMLLDYVSSSTYIKKSWLCHYLLCLLSCHTA